MILAMVRSTVQVEEALWERQIRTTLFQDDTKVADIIGWAKRVGDVDTLTIREASVERAPR